MNQESIQTPPQGHYTTVNGFQMYYEVHGKGSPLVLLHNFTGSTLFWQPYLAGLADHFKLIVIDMRGHGRSTNPTNQFTHRQSALDIFALMDQLEIEQFKAIGVSSGGMTLLHMATQQPERVEAMVLVGATIYFPVECRAMQRGASVEGWTPEDWEWNRQNHLHGDEQIRALVNQFRAMADSYDDMNFTAPYLTTIKARTLIVHGDRDVFFPVSIPVEMYTSIPNATLWIVPNGDHIPILEERASPFLQNALAFLQENRE
jgi:pimeloyl-ACP methyl ester carboxylesterase